MNDRDLVAFLFRAMLYGEFGTKTDMAEALNVPHRSLQRIFQRLDTATGATKAFQKLIWYCCDEDIDLTDLFHQFKRYRPEDSEIIMSVKRVSRMSNEKRNDHTDPEMKKLREVFDLLLNTVCNTCTRRLAGTPTADCIVSHIARSRANRCRTKRKKDDNEVYEQEGTHLMHWTLLERGLSQILCKVEICG
jgi:hypothetical protein